MVGVCRCVACALVMIHLLRKDNRFSRGGQPGSRNGMERSNALSPGSLERNANPPHIPSFDGLPCYPSWFILSQKFSVGWIEQAMHSVDGMVHDKSFSHLFPLWPGPRCCLTMSVSKTSFLFFLLLVPLC